MSDGQPGFEPGVQHFHLELQPPFIVMGLHPGKMLQVCDSAPVSSFDLTQIERAVAIARLRALADMLEQGF